MNINKPHKKEYLNVKLAVTTAGDEPRIGLQRTDFLRKNESRRTKKTNEKA
jgi:hypothetical protein